ncbi:MAG: hypothetical protein WA814_01010, partial [Candidatus Baltobacteraceae bacterium]
MQPARIFTFVIGALALGACTGNAAIAPAGSGALLPATATIQPPPQLSQGRGGRNLYVTSASPSFFNEYRLPLRSDEAPTLTETGINEPVPIADNGRNLYVASFDDSEVFTYKLPLVSGPPSQGFFADVADP